MVTAKFGTCVVDNTTNGAVPVVTVLRNCVPDMLPLTCSLSMLLSVAEPITTLPEYCASLTKPVSITSILGIPEMSLTEKIVPV